VNVLQDEPNARLLPELFNGAAIQNVHWFTQVALDISTNMDAHATSLNLRSHDETVILFVPVKSIEFVTIPSSTQSHLR
jgi:hypothetical protein